MSDVVSYIEALPLATWEAVRKALFSKGTVDYMILAPSDWPNLTPTQLER